MVDGGEVKTTFIKKNQAYVATGADVDWLTFTNLKDKIIVHISTTNLVNPTTIKVKETINGVVDHVTSNKIFPTNFDAGVTGLIYVLDGGGEDMRITLDSGAAASVNIGYNQRREDRSF